MSHSTDELISVIVPVYNTGKEFLLECFESVRTQDYNNIELIIIDDGSTDEATENFCREYAENNENLVKCTPKKCRCVCRKTERTIVIGWQMRYVFRQ